MNLTEFLKLLVRAEGGHSESQYLMGLQIEACDVLNSGDALPWFEKAARQGHPDAQVRLASLYRDGVGVRKNIRKALAWFQRAAVNGSSIAMVCIGLLKLPSSAKAKRSAIKWFKQASSAGNKLADWNLGLCYLEGDGVEKDEHLGFRLILKAARSRNPLAQAKLADLYSHGRAVRKDLQRAKFWRRMAIQNGFVFVSG